MTKTPPLIHTYMNVITRSANNELILTLSERATLDNPYYLVRAECIATREVKRFILPSDTSSYPLRYNKFTITESASEILTSGTVELSPAGDWKFSVYEQESATNLSEWNALTLLEEGLFKVVEADALNTYLYADGQDKQYVL